MNAWEWIGGFVFGAVVGVVLAVALVVAGIFEIGAFPHDRALRAVVFAVGYALSLGACIAAFVFAIRLSHAGKPVVGAILIGAAVIVLCLVSTCGTAGVFYSVMCIEGPRSICY